MCNAVRWNEMSLCSHVNKLWMIMCVWFCTRWLPLDAYIHLSPQSHQWIWHVLSVALSFFQSLCVCVSLSNSLYLPLGLFNNMVWSVCALRYGSHTHKHIYTHNHTHTHTIPIWSTNISAYALLLDPKLTNSVGWNHPKIRCSNNRMYF